MEVDKNDFGGNYKPKVKSISLLETIMEELNI